MNFPVPLGCMKVYVAVSVVSTILNTIKSIILEPADMFQQFYLFYFLPSELVEDGKSLGNKWFLILCVA